jgi:hypothetical protein
MWLGKTFFASARLAGRRPAAADSDRPPHRDCEENQYISGY